MVSFNQIDNNTLLEDDRVLLRPLQKEDYDNLLNFSLNEPDLWKYSLVQPIGEEGLKNYLKFLMMNEQKKQSSLLLYLTKKVMSTPAAQGFTILIMLFKLFNLDIHGMEKNFRALGLTNIVNFYSFDMHLKFLI